MKIRKRNGEFILEPWGSDSEALLERFADEGAHVEVSRAKMARTVKEKADLEKFRGSSDLPQDQSEAQGKQINRFAKLVRVEWVDSAQPYPQWSHLEDLPSLEPVKCCTVGWLIAESEEVLMIAQSVGEVNTDNAQASGLMRIPRASVKSLLQLGLTQDQPTQKLSGSECRTTAKPDAVNFGNGRTIPVGDNPAKGINYSNFIVGVGSVGNDIKSLAGAEVGGNIKQ
ncbi:hypothetical protein [Microbulbifer epialgicus]|uniref:Uncharacterized protein n=1 Tax=Microbulbifer epialgicus TaxID=393907 RepID=A0ABV4P691_9GAMM